MSRNDSVSRAADGVTVEDLPTGIPSPLYAGWERPPGSHTSAAGGSHAVRNLLGSSAGHAELGLLHSNMRQASSTASTPRSRWIGTKNTASSAVLSDEIGLDRRPDSVYCYSGAGATAAGTTRYHQVLSPSASCRPERLARACRVVSVNSHEPVWIPAGENHRPSPD